MRKETEEKLMRWANAMKYAGLALSLIGVIGLYAVIMPDYEFEMTNVYLFAAAAYVGFACLLFFAAATFMAWVREKENQKKLFAWAKRWRYAFIGLMLIGALGEMVLAALEWPVDLSALAGLFEEAEEVGGICAVFCVAVLYAEGRMRRREEQNADE